MDSAEFADWMLEYRCEPWGEGRADLRMAIMASAMANLHTALRETLLALWAKGWKRGATKPFTPADFLPDFSHPLSIEQPAPSVQPAPLTEQEQAAQWQAFFLNLTEQVGGTVQNGHV